MFLPTAIAVADDWIVQPADPWEVTASVNNVVFTCGADQVMCVGTAKIDDLVDLCLKSPRPAI